MAVPDFQRVPNLVFKWFDDNNDPANGYHVKTYLAGTTIEEPTYADPSGSTANPTDITLDLRGEADIFLKSDRLYKFVISDANDLNPVTFDNISGSGGVAEGGSGTGDNKVLVNAADAVSGYLAAKILAGANVSIDIDPAPTGSTMTINATNDKVKVNSSDPVAGYLIDKLVSNNGSITIGNNGGSLSLQVDPAIIPDAYTKAEITAILADYLLKTGGTITGPLTVNSTLTADVVNAIQLQLDGVNALDGNGKINSTFIPALAITDTFVVASQAAMLALTGAEKGDVAVRTDLNKCYILAGTDSTVLADWQELLTPTDLVLSVDGLTGAVNLENKYLQIADAQSAIGYVSKLGDTMTGDLVLASSSGIIVTNPGSSEDYRASRYWGGSATPFTDSDHRFYSIYDYALGVDGAAKSYGVPVIKGRTDTGANGAIAFQTYNGSGWDYLFVTNNKLKSSTGVVSFANPISVTGDINTTGDIKGNAFRATGNINTAGLTGNGVEIVYNNISDYGRVLSYDRTSGAVAYRPLRLEGSELQLTTSGSERAKVTDTALTSTVPLIAQNAWMGDWTISSEYASFGHKDFATTGFFQQLFRDTGEVHFASRNNTVLHLRSYNADNSTYNQIRMDATNIGIGGTINATYPIWLNGNTGVGGNVTSIGDINSRALRVTGALDWPSLSGKGFEASVESNGAVRLLAYNRPTAGRIPMLFDASNFNFFDGTTYLLSLQNGVMSQIGSRLDLNHGNAMASVGWASNSTIRVTSTDTVLELASSEAATWGSVITLKEFNDSNKAFADAWSIARQTTNGLGDGSFSIQYGTNTNGVSNFRMLEIDTSGNSTFIGNIESTRCIVAVPATNGEGWLYTGYSNASTYLVRSEGTGNSVILHGFTGRDSVTTASTIGFSAQGTGSSLLDLSIDGSGVATSRVGHNFSQYARFDSSRSFASMPNYGVYRDNVDSTVTYKSAQGHKRYLAEFTEWAVYDGTDSNQTVSNTAVQILNNGLGTNTYKGALVNVSDLWTANYLRSTTTFKVGDYIGIDMDFVFAGPAVAADVSILVRGYNASDVQVFERPVYRFTTKGTGDNQESFSCRIYVGPAITSAGRFRFYMVTNSTSTSTLKARSFAIYHHSLDRVL